MGWHALISGVRSGVRTVATGAGLALGVGVGLLLLVGPSLPAQHPQAKPLRPLPYPPSSLLTGLTWTTQPHCYPGIHSDMHWQTWGADDALYCVDPKHCCYGYMTQRFCLQPAKP